MTPIANRRLHGVLPLLVALTVIAIVFWPALFGSFIFDDYPNFADNQAVQIHDWSWQAWRGVWMWSTHNIQRPLSVMSYALNYVLGASPWGFKATNLAIHLLNTALLAALARRILAAGWSRDERDDHAGHLKRTCTWGLILATAWAMHPLQVSAVMYVVQRMELLGFTFTLLALLAYWRARRQQSLGQRAWPWLVLSGSMVVIGYYAKQTAILTPGYALLLELTVLHFQASRPSIERVWRMLYALGCASAVALFVFYLLPNYATSAAFIGRDFSAWERVLTQMRVLSMYIGWSVFPLPSQMHFYYDGYVASTGWLHPASTLAGGIFLAALLVLAIGIRKQRPLMALGIGWFFIAHALTSAPIALELVFEHRNYPALFGVLLVLTDLVWLATRHAHPRMPALLATIFIVSLGFFTVIRSATWGNPLQLSLTLAKENPSSSRASYDLATRYMLMSEGDPTSPMYGRTVAELERAAALPNSSPLPDQALLLMAAGGGVPLQQIWWDRFLHKLQTRPIGPQERNALNRLATVRIDDGNTGVDAKELQHAYQIMVARQPQSSQWHVEYADLASVALNDTTLAIEQLIQALEIERRTPNYASRLVSYLIGHQRDHEALAVIAKAEELHPTLRSDTAFLALQAQARQGLKTPAATKSKP